MTNGSDLVIMNSYVCISSKALDTNSQFPDLIENAMVLYKNKKIASKRIEQIGANSFISSLDFGLVAKYTMAVDRKPMAIADLNPRYRSKINRDAKIINRPIRLSANERGSPMTAEE